MSFEPICEAYARSVMRDACPVLEDKYVTLIRFLIQHPGHAKKFKDNTPEVGTLEYITKLAGDFINGRRDRVPKTPTTVPDPIVPVILKEYFQIRSSDFQKVTKYHLISMGMENFTGYILERYIASIAEQHGWVWCSGSMVRAVDFIKPLENEHKNWRLLQVKNRDNSENSSSSAIRDGTKIGIWHRTFSRKKDLNWASFPDPAVSRLLSEDGFVSFVKTYLRNLKR